MVATGREGVGEPSVGRSAVVPDQRGLAVYRLVPDDQGAEGFTQRLVAEADAEDRHPSREVPDGLDGDPRLRRDTGAGRDDQGLVVLQPLHTDGVVAEDLRLGAELGQVLDQVVSERVVVVEHRDPHGMASARSMAASMAPAFSRVSSNSRLGTEAATTPAPACT